MGKSLPISLRLVFWNGHSLYQKREALLEFVEHHHVVFVTFWLKYHVSWRLPNFATYRFDCTDDAACLNG